MRLTKHDHKTFNLQKIPLHYKQMVLQPYLIRNKQKEKQK